MSYRTYTAYVRPVTDVADNGIDVVVVPDKFSFGAMIFGPIWALFNQMWFVAGILAILYLFLLVMADFQGSGLLFLGLVLVCGFEAMTWKGWSLEKKGFVATGIVGGDDEDTAIRRFFQLLAAGEITLPRFASENRGWASHVPVAAENAGNPER